MNEECVNLSDVLAVRIRRNAKISEEEDVIWFIFPEVYSKGCLSYFLRLPRVLFQHLHNTDKSAG